jgi:hypothetical protein
MKSKAIVLVILSCMLMGNVSKLPAKPSPMSSFRWLEGSWYSDRKNGVMEERWATVNDSSMHAVSTIHRPDGRVEPFETADLLYRRGIYAYIVAAPAENGGDTVRFPLTSYTDRGFVAENPQHDFPRRISYHWRQTDTLLAVIDAGPEKPEEKVDFLFYRKKK